jgi:hypothetical protein
MAEYWDRETVIERRSQYPHDIIFFGFEQTKSSEAFLVAVRFQDLPVATMASPHRLRPRDIKNIDIIATFSNAARALRTSGVRY